MLGAYSEILTLDDVCEILCVGKSTAYRLLSCGDLMGFKIERVWKIKQNKSPNPAAYAAKLEL